MQLGEQLDFGGRLRQLLVELAELVARWLDLAQFADERSKTREWHFAFRQLLLFLIQSVELLLQLED